MSKQLLHRTREFIKDQCDQKSIPNSSQEIDDQEYNAVFDTNSDSGDDIDLDQLYTDLNTGKEELRDLMFSVKQKYKNLLASQKEAVLTEVNERDYSNLNWNIQTSKSHEMSPKTNSKLLDAKKGAISAQFSNLQNNGLSEVIESVNSTAHVESLISEVETEQNEKLMHRDENVKEVATLVENITLLDEQ